MTDHPFSVPRYEPQAGPADLLVTQYRDAGYPAAQQLVQGDYARNAALQQALAARLELARGGLRLGVSGV